MATALVQPARAKTVMATESAAASFPLAVRAACTSARSTCPTAATSAVCGAVQATGAPTNGNCPDIDPSVTFQHEPTAGAVFGGSVGTAGERLANSRTIATPASTTTAIAGGSHRRRLDIGETSPQACFR